MHDLIPFEAWAVILLGVLAIAPAKYVFEHLRNDPDRRDITRPPDDFSWRTRAKLVRSLAFLALIGGAGIAVFTVDLRAIARQPSVLAAFLAGLGLLALGSVIGGFRNGTITPYASGTREYSLEEEPVRFWLSMAFNSLLGAFMIGLAPFTFAEPQSRSPSGCQAAEAQGLPCVVIPAISPGEHFRLAIQRSQASDDAGWRREWKVFRSNVPGYSLQSYTDELDEADLRTVVGMTTQLMEQDPRNEFALEIRGNALWRLGDHAAAQADDEQLDRLRQGKQ